MCQLTKNGGQVLFLVLGTVGLYRFVSTSTSIDSNVATLPKLPKTDNSNYFNTTPEDVDDGCRIDSNRSNIQYERYSALDEEEISYYQSVRNCVTENFERSLLRGDTSGFMDWNRLICSNQIDHSTILSVMEQHDRILLIGDSVVRQQYFTLICMVDPNLKHEDMVKFNITDQILDGTQWDYQHRADGQNKTSFLYRVLGKGFDPLETNLYRDAFPTAVLTFGEKDAIIVDASRHYNESDATALYLATHFVAFAKRTRVPIYYMEPSPLEYPTSNGFYPSMCTETICRCERLDEARLQGKGALSNALVETLVRQNNGSFPTWPAISPILYDLYPALLSNIDSLNTTLCIPTCVPATWRSDLTKMVFRNAAPHVTIVPTFWQLVSQDRPTTLKQTWDCTHRHFAGIILMNEQLIRSMEQQQRLGSSSRNQQVTT